MIRKISILYAWLVRALLFFAPDLPLVMRFRGLLYSVFMRKCGLNFQVSHSCIINSLSCLSVGDNVYFANNTHLFCGGNIDIGSNVIVAPGVILSSNNHSFLIDSGYRYGPSKFSAVKIGKGSWICANSVVVAGSSFPPYSVLAPCSLYKDKSWSQSRVLYSGNPSIVVQELENR